MESTLEGRSTNTMVKNILGTVMTTFSLVGNLTLLLVTHMRIRRPGRRCSSIYFLLRSLAIADLIVSAVFVPIQLGWMRMESDRETGGSWVIETAGACNIIAFLNTFGLYMSALSIVSITVNIYLEVLKESTVREAAERAADMEISTRLIALICSIPEAMIHRVQVVPSVPGMKMCTPSGSLKSEKVELVFTLFHNILSGGVPVATMLACYPYMLFKLQRMQRDADSPRHGHRNRRNVIGWAEARKFKLSVLICVTFLICWLPYHTFMFLDCIGLSGSSNLHPGIIHGMQFLAGWNQCFNPAICGCFYFWKSRSRSGAAGTAGTTVIQMSTLLQAERDTSEGIGQV